ncbi:MAG: hypothetical protein WC658_00960 [Candidatus Omnitrophota bacterium]
MNKALGKTILRTGLVIFIFIFLLGSPVFAELNEEAALAIAKGYMRDNGYGNDYVLFWPSITDDYKYENSWHITFPPTVTSFLEGRFSFGVDVDKETGKVISSDAMK